MPAQLLSLAEGPNILLDKPIVLIGRHEECDIQLNSRKVSRKHCCIAQVNEYFVIRDLGSTNGVRINGVRVMEGAIRPGDEVTIGDYRYQIQAEAAMAASPAADSKNGTLPKVSEDDLLESADQPVPLADAPGARILSARKAPPPPFGNADNVGLRPESSLRPPAPPV
jgi:predicted component of type VI protein secretion system